MNSAGTSSCSSRLTLLLANSSLFLVFILYKPLSPEIYLDAAGLPTIGYGHLLRSGEDEMFKNGISSEAGEALLIKDVLYAECAVLRLIRVPLTDGQFDALVSFTFNLGGGALQRSTLRRKVNREEHEESASRIHALGLGWWS